MALSDLFAFPVNAKPGVSQNDAADSALNAALSGSAGLLVAPQAAQTYSQYNNPVTTQQTASYDPSVQQGIAAQTAAQQAAAAQAAQAAATKNYYNQLIGQVDSQLGSLDQQANVGRGNIMDSWQAAFNTLTNNKSLDQRNYNQNRTSTLQDNVAAKSQIDENVATEIDGLQRLLGSVGAGDSSAASILAPFAAGRNGNVQRANVNNTLSRNLAGLDQAWDDTQTGYTNAFGSLDADKNNQLNDLTSRMAQTRANLLGQRQQYQAYNGQTIDANTTNQINDLNNQVTALGRKTTFTPQLVTAKTYNLADYSNAGASALQANNAVQAQTGAYYNLLNPYDKEKMMGVA